MTIATEIELEPLSQPNSDAKPLAGSAWPFLGAVKIRVAVRVYARSIVRGGARLGLAAALRRL